MIEAMRLYCLKPFIDYMLAVSRNCEQAKSRASNRALPTVHDYGYYTVIFNTYNSHNMHNTWCFKASSSTSSRWYEV